MNDEQTQAPQADDYESQLRAANEEVYKHSLELAVTNKTLSLLRRLYEASVAVLEKEALAEQICALVRQEFEFETAGMFLYNDAEHTLKTLAIVSTDAVNAAKGEHRNVAPQPGTDEFWTTLLQKKQMTVTQDVTDLWQGALPDTVLDQLQDVGRVRSIAAYPLFTEERILGLFILALNRPYGELAEYEKEAINSVVSVITASLDKALLYEQLKVANKRLRELDRQKSEFLSMAAHQLRTPLTAIRGYTSLILEGSYGEMSAEIKKIIETTFASSSRMVDTVNDFLNVSRIEQGKMEYRKIDADICEIAERVVYELSLSAKDKGLELTYHTDIEGTCPIFADVTKIEHVISNLVDNAIKYTPHGSVDVSVVQVGNKARVLIKDTGAGIAPETIPTLFQKFIRARNAQDINVTGTGLGLYVARQMIRAHDGDVWAESEGVGKGSTFVVEIPLKSK